VDCIKKRIAAEKLVEKAIIAKIREVKKSALKKKYALKEKNALKKAT
jgi:hypothetical protein